MKPWERAQNNFLQSSPDTRNSIHRKVSKTPVLHHAGAWKCLFHDAKQSPIRSIAFLCFRVDEDVTALIPHRPLRAQLRHKVLHSTDSLTCCCSSCAQFELSARETV